MANSYTQATPEDPLKCTREEHEALVEALNNIEEPIDENDHGFVIDPYSEKHGEFYFYAEEYCNESGLPDKFLELLGKLIEKNNQDFLRVGISWGCDKMRPGEFGGSEFRIYKDGSLVYPKIVYPEDESE